MNKKELLDNYKLIHTLIMRSILTTDGRIKYFYAHVFNNLYQYGKVDVRHGVEVATGVAFAFHEIKEEATFFQVYSEGLLPITCELNKDGDGYVFTRHTDKKSVEINTAIDDVIKYLNLVTSQSYRLNTKSTRTAVESLLKKQYTVDDIKSVIDTKAKEWLNNEMAKYLRPETLFGQKFESYFNQSKVQLSSSGSGRLQATFDVTKELIKNQIWNV